MRPTGCGRSGKRPTQMTTPRARGGSVARDRLNRSSAATENGFEFLRRHYLELRIGAIARLLVGTPPAKLGRVPETIALHMIVGDFDDQFRTQRLPRKVLALAPSALAARNALPAF